VTIIQYLIRNARYHRAHLHWLFFDDAYKIGDPSLGHGEIREQNRERLLDRKFAREPLPNHFGLNENEILSLRWVGCFSALALGLTLCSIALWGNGPPWATIVLLVLALLALFFALWQYNQARFEKSTTQ
jgi:hypothetical protein